jgi:hypothetical protein
MGFLVGGRDACQSYSAYQVYWGRQHVVIWLQQLRILRLSGTNAAHDRLQFLVRNLRMHALAFVSDFKSVECSWPLLNTRWVQ